MKDKKMTHYRIITGSSFGSGYLELQNKRFGFWCSFERIFISPDAPVNKIKEYLMDIAKDLDWELK